MKLAVSILVLFSCFFIGYSPQCNAAENVGVVNLDVANEPLGQVVRRIAHQTGYNIVILEDWKKVSISGKFVNVPVDAFFRRALKGRSIFLTVDEKRKQIIVRAVGKDSSRKFAVATVKGTTTGNELDVTPGIRRMDVVDGPAYGPDVDPMDLEVTPGIRRRDVIKGTVGRLVVHAEAVKPILPPLQSAADNR